MACPVPAEVAAAATSDTKENLLLSMTASIAKVFLLKFKFPPIEGVLEVK